MPENIERSLATDGGADANAAAEHADRTPESIREVQESGKPIPMGVNVANYRRSQPDPTTPKGWAERAVLSMHAARFDLGHILPGMLRTADDDGKCMAADPAVDDLTRHIEAIQKWADKQ